MPLIFKLYEKTLLCRVWNTQGLDATAGSLFPPSMGWTGSPHVDIFSQTIRVRSKPQESVKIPLQKWNSLSSTPCEPRRLPVTLSLDAMEWGLQGTLPKGTLCPERSQMENTPATLERKELPAAGKHRSQPFRALPDVTIAACWSPQVLPTTGRGQWGFAFQGGGWEGLGNGMGLFGSAVIFTVLCNSWQN